MFPAGKPSTENDRNLSNFIAPKLENGHNLQKIKTKRKSERAERNILRHKWKI